MYHLKTYFLIIFFFYIELYFQMEQMEQYKK